MGSNPTSRSSSCPCRCKTVPSRRAGAFPAWVRRVDGGLSNHVETGSTPVRGARRMQSGVHPSRNNPLDDPRRLCTHRLKGRPRDFHSRNRSSILRACARANAVGTTLEPVTSVRFRPAVARSRSSSGRTLEVVSANLVALCPYRLAAGHHPLKVRTLGSNPARDAVGMP